MKITLCMIVKNEEKNIVNCLERALQIVDEAIVVDTGSTDTTVQILKDNYRENKSVKIIEYEWENDFSKARNKSLEYATGDWILILDADERIFCDRKRLEEFLDSKEELAYRIPIYNIFDKNNFTVSVSMIRLFKNNNPKYRGAIHEQIELDGVPYAGEIIDEKICKIYHYGYNTNVFNEKNKNKRNMDIIKAEIKKNPKDPFNWYNKGVMEMIAGNYSKAIDDFIKSHKLTNGVRMAYHNDLVIKIIQCMMLLNNYKQAIEFIKDVSKDELIKSIPDIYYYLGMCYAKLKKYDYAIDNFKKAIEIGEYREGISKFGVGSFLPMIEWAKVLELKNERKLAIEKYKEAVFNEYNINKLGLDDLKKLLISENMMDELKRIETVINNEEKPMSNYEELKKLGNELKNNIQTLVENGMLEEAKETIKEYESIIENDADVYSIKGVIAMMEGDMKKAEAAFKEGLIIDETNFDLLYNLGYLYQLDCKDELAIFYYKKALQNSKEQNEVELVSEILKKFGVSETEIELLKKSKSNLYGDIKNCKEEKKMKEEMNNRLFLQKEFFNRLKRIKYAQKQSLRLRKYGDSGKIRIVFVMTHVGICGGVKIIFEHANRLKRQGLDVTIVSHYPVPDWFPIEVNYIKVPFNIELAEGIPECDVIVATYWDHIQACIDRNIAPVVYFEQGDFHIFDYKGVNDVLKDFIYKQYQLPKFILTVSGRCANLIKDIYKRDSFVIHNAIDTTIFNAQRHKEVKSDTSYILAIGNPQLAFKGINEIISAHIILKKVVPNIKLYLVSPVEIDDYIKAKIDKVFVNPSQEKIADLYRNASVYVSASHYESFSLPVLEAMACGCPVVTTNNYGVLEYAEDNYNVLIAKIGDPYDISNKILEILQNDVLRKKLISNGLLTVKRFNWDNIICQLLNYYQNVARYEVSKDEIKEIRGEEYKNMYGSYIGDNKMLVKTVWGGKLICSSNDMSLMPDLVSYGFIESSLTTFFLKKLKEGDIVIDVGANIGYYTILAGIKVGNSGRVIAFEANDSVYSILMDNVSINYLNDRVTLFNKAVYSQDQEISFFVTERFSGNASIHQPDKEYYDYFLVDKGMEEKKVQAIALDNFFNRGELIDYIKIDVEGGEYHCLLGMQDMIRSKRVRTVIFELNKLRSKEDSEKLYTLLMKLQNECGVKYGIINNEGEVIQYSLNEIFKYDFIPSVVMDVV